MQVMTTLPQENLNDVPRAARNAEMVGFDMVATCLLYTSPSPRDRTRSRMPSSA